jgi:hypothetical protein
MCVHVACGCPGCQNARTNPSIHHLRRLLKGYSGFVGHRFAGIDATRTKKLATVQINGHDLDHEMLTTVFTHYNSQVRTRACVRACGACVRA